MNTAIPVRSAVHGIYHLAMPMNDHEVVIAALSDCEAALEKLDRLCCEPGRSPRMAEVGKTLDAARAMVDELGDDTRVADSIIATLEHAGGLVGALQVGCCTAARMPLYGRFLEGLTTAQITINHAAGRSH